MILPVILITPGSAMKRLLTGVFFYLERLTLMSNKKALMANSASKMAKKVFIIYWGCYSIPFFSL